MTDVFNLIFQGIEGGYNILKGFNISAYGFSFSLWDFLVALFVLSFIVPLVVAPDHTGSFSNIVHWVSGRGERNDRAYQSSLRDDYYLAKTDYYKGQREFYNAKIKRYRDLARKK